MSKSFDLFGQTLVKCDMDGKHFPMKEYQVGLTAPPFHPNCRGTTCPYFDDDFGTRVGRDENGNTVEVPADMTYEEWKQKFVDIDDESDIIKADVTINSRSSGKGNANAILHFDVDLNNRQQKLLNSLPEFDSRVIVKKSDVKLSDLSALTAKTGDEFAIFTKQGKRLVVRGNNTMVNITVEKAVELAQAGYRWSGHTHPGTDSLCLVPSNGDIEILAVFGQSKGAIYNSKGDKKIF